MKYVGVSHGVSSQRHPCHRAYAIGNKSILIYSGGSTPLCKPPTHPPLQAEKSPEEVVEVYCKS